MNKLIVILLFLCGCACWQTEIEPATPREYLDSLLQEVEVEVDTTWYIDFARPSTSCYLIFFSDTTDYDTLLVIQGGINKTDVLVDTFKLIIPADWQIIKENGNE